MEKFNVINFDFNRNKFESYNVMTYLVNAYHETVKTYKELKKKFDKTVKKSKKEQEIEMARTNLENHKVPVTFKEFKEFVKKESQYQFWARCEYEIILRDWPSQKTSEKWDVYDQIMMNLDIVTELLMKSVKDGKTEED